MSLTKNDFDRLDARLKSIIEQPVEEIEIDSDLPPTIEQLEDNNKTYSISAAILFTKTSHTQNGLRTLKIQYFS